MECSEPEIKGCKMSLSCPEPHERTVEVVFKSFRFLLGGTEMHSSRERSEQFLGQGAELGPPVTAALISFFLLGQTLRA